MRKLILTAAIALQALLGRSQVTTDPAMPIASQPVVITFHADEGTAGLKGYSGDVYAHTGVITTKSTSTSDWQHVKAAWSTNLPACKLTRTSTDTYTLSITPSVNEFYGVDAGETILQMAFVFRGSTGSPEGKATGGKDILVDVYQGELSVAFQEPSDAFVFADAGSTLTVKVGAVDATQISLAMDGVQIAQSATSPLTHSLTVPASGTHTLEATATNGSRSATDRMTLTVAGTTVEAARPAAATRRGYNRHSDTEGTLVLYAPGKQRVYVAGSFNDWQPFDDYLMKRDGDYFWLTLSGLTPGTEYAYQYWIDSDVRVADPYTNKALDPWNDRYIPASVYPGLMDYPEGLADNLVSVFCTAEDVYDWQVDNFEAPAADRLVVYELLLRDFTDAGTVSAAIDRLDYLQDLGVTAVELMPINEFEGNSSWGYNPSLYFAPDKAYGRPDDYRRFVDECHKRGMAVIIDMVLNHSFGQSPFVRMYWNSELQRPAADNPWYNEVYAIKNPDLQWGYDFNHESTETQALVDSICSFWLNSYRVDGFRFDFTKGFTNTEYPADSWAGTYDQSRIDILTRMAGAIRAIKPDAYIICEHLADNDEETVLADAGLMLWGNFNYAYNQLTMGWLSSSSISGVAYKSKGWSRPNLVAYMESHDEERLMYKNMAYGNTSATGYDATDLATALARCEAAATLFFPVPGPKMIWQFGEMGYDISIDDNGRTGEKPVCWNYLNSTSRAHLVDVYRALVRLRAKWPVFGTDNFTVSTSATSATRSVILRHDEGSVVAVANFDVAEATATVLFPAVGTWFDYFNNTTYTVMSAVEKITLAPGEYHLFSQQDFGAFETPYTATSGIDAADIAAVADGLTLCPVPAGAELGIGTTLGGSKTLGIFALDGRRVLTGGFAGSSTVVDVAGLPRGVYVLHLDSESGRQARRFVKK